MSGCMSKDDMRLGREDSCSTRPY